MLNLVIFQIERTTFQKALNLCKKTKSCFVILNCLERPACQTWIYMNCFVLVCFIYLWLRFTNENERHIIKFYSQLNYQIIAARNRPKFVNIDTKSNRLIHSERFSLGATGVSIRLILAVCRLIVVLGPICNKSNRWSLWLHSTGRLDVFDFLEIPRWLFDRGTYSYGDE